MYTMYRPIQRFACHLTNVKFEDTMIATNIANTPDMTKIDSSMPSFSISWYGSNPMTTMCITQGNPNPIQILNVFDPNTFATARYRHEDVDVQSKFCNRVS